MPNSVIQRVQEFGKDQPEQFIFTDRKGRTIGDIEPISSHYALDDDEHIEIPGVDRGEIETPQITEDTNRNPASVIQDDKALKYILSPMTTKKWIHRF